VLPTFDENVCGGLGSPLAARPLALRASGRVEAAGFTIGTTIVRVVWTSRRTCASP
jgi:hypothetical protein